jgi:hypothetical protein
LPGGRIFHCLHGVGRDAQGAVASRETVTFPNNINSIIVGENCSQFAVLFYDESDGDH